jgi:hypothetical protein
MPKRIIKATKWPSYTRSDYLRYFRELTEEYLARAARIEKRLLAGGTIIGSPDWGIYSPTCEFEDALCLTDLTKADLQAVLPDFFDAYRRLTRAQTAGSRARRVKRPERLSICSGGLDSMLKVYLEGWVWPSNAESQIDEWLGRLTGPCTWSEHDHFGHQCQKPVEWPWNEMGGGRS